MSGHSSQPGAFENALLHVRDEKASGTQGGTFTLGADRLRDLNTVVTNEIAGASLASNQITLPAGEYDCEAFCPSRGVNANKAHLYDTTGAAILIVGQSAKSYSGSDINTLARVSGRFTLTEESALELRHRCGGTKTTNGFGEITSFGLVEVYSDIKIWKVG